MAARYGLLGSEKDTWGPAIEALNQSLVAAGLKPHVEPEDVPQDQRFSCQMWGYTGLHQLRRIAAYTALNRELYAPNGELIRDDAVVGEYYAHVQNGDVSALPFQHLMLHGDGEGYYVPQDFERVVNPGPACFKQVGGGIGSSYRLLSECRLLASVLELPMTMTPESPEIWAAAREPGIGSEPWSRYGIESFSCIRLIRACEASIKTGSLVVFC
ncbi:MAG: hypothetical protein AB7E72_14230 [Lysobacterales bacterium]